MQDTSKSSKLSTEHRAEFDFRRASEEKRIYDECARLQNALHQ